MNVLDIMTEKPVTINSDGTLRESLELMERVGCHHLPVVNQDNHLIGILSASDCRVTLNSPNISRECWEEHDQIDQIPVRAMMTPAPIVVEPNISAEEAARLMLVNHINCIPVMRTETLIGIVTTSDILMAFMLLQERIKRVPVDTSDSLSV